MIIYQKKSTVFSHLKIDTAKLFENFLYRFFFCIHECMCARACVSVRSSGGAVHALNDGPRQIETAECRPNWICDSVAIA